VALFKAVKSLSFVEADDASYSACAPNGLYAFAWVRRNHSVSLESLAHESPPGKLRGDNRKYRNLVFCGWLEGQARRDNKTATPFGRWPELSYFDPFPVEQSIHSIGEHAVSDPL
jgi:hypothetical protein